MQPKTSSGAMWNDLGASRFRLREFTDAITAFDQALQRDCEHAEVLSNRGAALAAINELDRAREEFERALQINPDCESARKHQAMLDDLSPSGAAASHERLRGQ